MKIRAIYTTSSVRSDFTDGATIVYGRPSTYGTWGHEDCYAIEIDFLSLSRFEPSATERFATEEDEFCKRVELIGGRFYESEYAYNKQQTARQDSSGLRLWCGWPGDSPGGAVWALWNTDSEAAGMGVSRIRNALTMTERCEAIEMLGGRLYKRWEDVAHPDHGLEKSEL